MFIKKDLRKVQQILDDPDDERREIKLFRRGPEFVKGPKILFRPENAPKFGNLRYLSLYGNSLSTVEGIGVLKDAPLEELNLGDNLLQNLPEEFRQLTQLKSLWIEDNEFVEFPGAILGLGDLERLCASGNALRSVPPEIRTLLALRNLSLNNNSLEKLPPQLTQLSELVHLDISGNQLRNLPESLGELTKLTGLITSSNQLESLPTSMSNLSQLAVLRINRNQLESLPDFLVELLQSGSLRYINASNNKLVSVPSKLFGFLPETYFKPGTKELKDGAPREKTEFPHPVEVVLLGNPNIHVGLAADTPLKKLRVADELEEQDVDVTSNIDDENA